MTNIFFFNPDKQVNFSFPELSVQELTYFISVLLMKKRKDIPLLNIFLVRNARLRDRVGGISWGRKTFLESKWN